MDKIEETSKYVQSSINLKMNADVYDVMSRLNIDKLEDALKKITIEYHKSDALIHYKIVDVETKEVYKETKIMPNWF